MSHNTPFHQDNSTPPPPPPFKPAEPKKKSSLASVPVWAWGIGALLLALIITLAVTLGGDDKEPEAVPAPAVTVTESAKPEPAPSITQAPRKTIEAAPPSSQERSPVAMSEREYLGFLREQFPILETVSDGDIMDATARTCDALDAGDTPEEVMMDSIKDVKSAEQAEAMGGITGGAVSNYCPEYYNDFTKFLNEQGVAVES